MNNNKIAFLSITTLLLVLFMHLEGMSQHLYIDYWFYDIIMHILGGAGIGFSILYVLKNPKYIIPISIIGGIAWELFEVYFNISGAKLWTTPYYLDTAKDLLDDTIGSMLAYLIITNKK